MEIKVMEKEFTAHDMLRFASMWSEADIEKEQLDTYREILSHEERIEYEKYLELKEKFKDRK
jgi:hypothetical protein